jgi:hypothetical protein
MIVDGRAGFRFAAAEIHEVLLAHGGPGADRLTMKTAGSRLLGIQEPLRWFAASLRRSFRFRRDQVQDHGSPHPWTNASLPVIAEAVGHQSGAAFSRANH